jgi:hypothetical protein
VIVEVFVCVGLVVFPLWYSWKFYKVNWSFVLSGLAMNALRWCHVMCFRSSHVPRPSSLFLSVGPDVGHLITRPVVDQPPTPVLLWSERSLKPAPRHQSPDLIYNLESRDIPPGFARRMKGVGRKKQRPAQ